MTPGRQRACGIRLGLILASVVNVLPLWVFPIGADIYDHLVKLACLGDQFWQGDLYPRWCLEANAGQGGPLLLFYSPLSYYMALPLYPLTWAGLGVYDLYAISALAATLITAFACHRWLSAIVSPSRALLATIIFLYMPYRIEVMFYRAAYAEMWFIAWVPFLCAMLRRFILDDTRRITGLAAVYAVMALTHLACASVMMILGGVYILIMSGKDWRSAWKYGVAALWGIAMAAFYIVPGVYYRQFVHEALSQIGASYGWPNTFLGMHNWFVLGQVRLLVAIALTLCFGAVMFIAVWRRRALIPSSFARRELAAWTAVAAVAVFLLFPWSAMFYALLGPLAEIVFPWRMQNAFAPSMAFLAAVWMEWLAPQTQRGTWKGNVCTMLGMLFLLSWSLVSVQDESYAETGKAIVRAKSNTFKYYQSIWTDDAHFEESAILSRYDGTHGAPVAAVQSGQGKVAIRAWGRDGLMIEAQAQQAMTVRIEHFYFPLWQGRWEDGSSAELRPDIGTGHMLVDVPAGEHRVTMTYNITRANPPLIYAANAISLLAWLLAVVPCWRRHCFDKRGKPC